MEQIPGLVYQRPKQSDLMQSIMDLQTIMKQEIEKLQRFYNFYDYNSNIYSNINSMEQGFYGWNDQVNDLRKKGL